MFLYTYICIDISTSPVALLGKNLLTNARDIRNLGAISGLGRSRGGAFDNPL